MPELKLKFVVTLRNYGMFEYFLWRSNIDVHYDYHFDKGYRKSEKIENLKILLGSSNIVL
jgi:hypothetical protein